MSRLISNHSYSAFLQLVGQLIEGFKKAKQISPSAINISSTTTTKNTISNHNNIMAETVQVWVKTTLIESILNPNVNTPHTRRLGMHGSLCE